MYLAALDLSCNMRGSSFVAECGLSCPTAEESSRSLFSLSSASSLCPSCSSLSPFSLSYHFCFRSSCLHRFALESSIRVLQRNRTSEIYSCVYSFRYGKIYYGELAHTVMEAEKSYNVLSARRRPREASGIIPV